jgi:hypothetical protein
MVLTLALVGHPLIAQQPARGCSPHETIGECWERLFPQPIDAEETAVVEKAAVGVESRIRETLSAKSAGLDALGAGFASALNDFLPTIAGALGLTSTTTEDGGAAFESNLPVSLGAGKQSVKLRLVRRKPALYQPMAEAFDTTGRTDRVTELEKQLRDFDDLELSAAVNFESDHYGRSFANHRTGFNALFRQAMASVSTQARDSAQRLFLAALPQDSAEILPDRRADEACDLADAEAVQFSCFAPQRSALLAVTLANTAAAMVEYRVALADRLTNSGFYQFADLVNNQPQLSLQTTKTIRRDLVGPDEWRFSATYEGGFANVNRLRGFCRSSLGGGARVERDEEIPLGCLSSYLDQPGTKSALRHGDRYSFSIEFLSRSEYHLKLASDSVQVDLDNPWSVTGKVAFGRYVAFSPNGDDVGRVDVSLEWMRPEDDPVRQQRVVGTFTYTHRVSPTLSVAAGFAYASKPEFLGDVDKKLSANFGLRYKFIQN